jgi:hypothetical protein
MRHIQRRYAIAFEILLSFQAVANTIVFVEYADFNFTLFAALTTCCFLFDFFFIVYLIRAQKLTCHKLLFYLICIKFMILYLDNHVFECVCEV